MARIASEIAAPEEMDIGGDLSAGAGSEISGGLVVIGRLRQLPQRSAPALQRRIWRPPGSRGDAGDLLDRMPQDIPEDHRAALQFRQPQERPEADRDDVRLGHGAPLRRPR